MGNKKHYMILDTETTTDARAPFDIAYTIIDRAGHVVEQKNYLVEEMFNNPVCRHMLLFDKYSKNKMDKYIPILQACGATPFAAIREEMRDVIKEYNCVVVAYNAKFDYECLTNFAQSLGFKNFFKDSTEIWDLWNIALHTIADSSRYVKFCEVNGFSNEKGNLKSSAEVMYRFLIDDVSFVESHTALDDTEIEAAIMSACLRRHKKLKTDYVGQVFRHPVWVKRCKA